MVKKRCLLTRKGPNLEKERKKLCFGKNCSCLEIIQQWSFFIISSRNKVNFTNDGNLELNETACDIFKLKTAVAKASQFKEQKKILGSYRTSKTCFNRGS